jgi:chemotaxis protein MotB
VSLQRPIDRRRRRFEGMQRAEDENSQRWLLTYADMITLLTALFIVMWSISATNGAKFEELRVSLKQALSGEDLIGSKGILDGERGILEPNGTPVESIVPRAVRVDPPQHELAGTSTGFARASLSEQLAERDLENLERVKVELERYAIASHLTGHIRTSIDERGLVIRLLTDDLLFNSGQAELRTGALPVLRKISALLASHRIPNNLRVEGNTDNVPISNALFRSNWELSAARATAVVQQLLEFGMPAGRLAIAGYADQRPVAPNKTAAGRQRNRRVELVVVRRALGGITQ